MRLSVICADDAGCSSFQCRTETDGLIETYRLFEKALTSGEGRLIAREQYDELPLDRDLFARDVSQIVEGCDVAGVRPDWITAAWERAGVSGPAETDDFMPSVGD